LVQKLTEKNEYFLRKSQDTEKETFSENI
jgi:hypothetical protein